MTESKVKHYDVEAATELPLKVTPDGPGSIKPITVMERFKQTVTDYPDRLALAVKVGGEYHNWTWSEYYDDVKTAAKSFIKLGLEPHHSVGIIGFNHPSWHIADLGAIFAGGFASGVYTTNGPDAMKYVVNHSKSQFIVAEDRKQLDKIISVQDELEHVKAVIVYNDKVPQVESKFPIMSWEDFMLAGKDVPDFELGQRMDAQKPGQCCTLIYTSGTTGTPKAVMITHDNITWTSEVLAQRMNLDPNNNETMVSYLPLSHIAAQIVDMHAPMVAGAAVWFAEPTALKGTLKNTMLDARPTLFLGVPRVWEKFEEAMKLIGSQSTGLKKTIATWAKGKGLEGSYAIQKGQSVPFGWSIANMLVFSKVRKNLGLDRCRFFATAAAPITKETLEFFLSLNIPLMEVYGMSENTGPCTVSIPGEHRTGSCGRLLPGTEIKINDPDEDGNGEICMRGRHVFKGYLYNDEKTQETIDEEGWLHSGDIGRLDADGFLYITGRIKELIITAGGENVAPVPIEDRVKEACPIISNCMLIGDKRKFLSMLITLKSTADPDTTLPLDPLTPPVIDFLAKAGANVKTVSEAKDSQAVKDIIQKAIDVANEQSVSRAQKVQKFTILDIDFSIPGDELGPTLKLKRPVVTKKYADVIEAFYN